MADLSAPEVQNWSALVLTILLIRRAWAPFSLWQKALLVACLSLIVADDFRISLGDVFGRYWPETWTHDNPSLIGTGRTVSIRFSAAMTSAVFRQGMRAGSWRSPQSG